MNGDDLRSLDNQESERLVFPINVHESLRASSGLKRGEKIGIIVSFWLFGCAIIGWILAGWLMSVLPDWYIQITLLVEIVLQLTVGVYILRFALGEKSLITEVENHDTSFAEYFSIYRGIKSTDSVKFPFDILEFTNGDYGVFIECRLGHNTQLRSGNTYEANKAVFDILNKANMPRKVFYHNEQFKSSRSAQDLRDILSNIKDPALFEAYRDIVQNYLSIAEEEGNTLCVTYIIYATTRIAKDDLVSIVRKVIDALTRDDNVYREVSILHYDEIIEFLRVQYRLEVIDMGLVRTDNAIRKTKYNCPVHVLALKGRSGKVYKNEEFFNLQKEIISDYGLEAVK